MKKVLFFVIIVLFIGACVIPGISGTIVKKMFSTENHIDDKYSNYNQEIILSGAITTALLIGPIHNLTIEEDHIKFNAGRIPGWTIRSFLKIFYINSTEKNKSWFLGDTVKISKQKIGIITDSFIFASCTIIPPTTKVTLNVSRHDEINHSIVWEVTKMEGDVISRNNFLINLWNENYTSISYSIMFEGSNDLLPGNRFTVQPDPSGYYETSFVDSVTGVTLADSVGLYY